VRKPAIYSGCGHPDICGLRQELPRGVVTPPFKEGATKASRTDCVRVQYVRQYWSDFKMDGLLSVSTQRQHLVSPPISADSSSPLGGFRATHGRGGVRRKDGNRSEWAMWSLHILRRASPEQRVTYAVKPGVTLHREFSLEIFADSHYMIDIHSRNGFYPSFTGTSRASLLMWRLPMSARSHRPAAGLVTQFRRRSTYGDCAIQRLIRKWSSRRRAPVVESRPSPWISARND